MLGIATVLLCCTHAIAAFAPEPLQSTCDIEGPSSVSQGDEGLAYAEASPFDPTLNYIWTIIDNTSGASFCGPVDGSTACVDAGPLAGSFTLLLRKGYPTGAISCSLTVDVAAPAPPLGVDGDVALDAEMPPKPLALGLDFRQAANHASPVPGEIQWLNSILQHVLVDIPPTKDARHVLRFSHQATGGGTNYHAYDFLTSWEQAIAAAESKGPFGENLLDALADPAVICGPGLGPQVTPALCASLWDPKLGPVVLHADLPDDMGT
ncbi:MAG: hypothetical protein ACYTG2_17200, partial [Planctomycetota bacterium]